MPKPREVQPADPERQPGFAPGKRVWFKETWDGAILARKHGEYANGMKVAPEAEIDPYGHLPVVLNCGTVVRVPKEHLRLTPPPGLANRQARAKEAKPPVRKEAVDPAFGTELTIFDALEAPGV